MKALALVCLTAWIIATEYLLVDLIEFNERIQLIDNVARGVRPKLKLENL
jgi:hypothetical protein